MKTKYENKAMSTNADCPQVCIGCKDVDFDGRFHHCKALRFWKDCQKAKAKCST